MAKPERYQETVDTFTTVAANLSELAQVSFPFSHAQRRSKREIDETDRTGSIDARDESTWCEGGDCEYGSMNPCVERLMDEVWLVVFSRISGAWLCGITMSL